MCWKWTCRKTPLFFAISTENSSDYELFQCKMQSSLNLKHNEQIGGKHFAIQANVLICTSIRWSHEKINPMSLYCVSSIARIR